VEDIDSEKKYNPMIVTITSLVRSQTKFKIVKLSPFNPCKKRKGLAAYNTNGTNIH
jgi:hypothetical protein